MDWFLEERKSLGERERVGVDKAAQVQENIQYFYNYCLALENS